MEKNIKKNSLYMYITELVTLLQQRLAQHCKSAILQLRNIFTKEREAATSTVS